MQAAYRACIKKYHPDHYKGTDARQRTADILEAYRLIGTANARSQFDRLSHPANDKRPPHETPPVNERRQTTSAEKASPAQPQAIKKNLLYGSILAGVSVAVFMVLGFLTGSDQTPQSIPPDAASARGPVVEVSSLPTSPIPSQQKIPNLDEVLQFRNPSTCDMTSATEKLFRKLMIFEPPEYVGRRGPPVTIAGFEKPLVPSFSRDVDTSEGRNVRDNEATLAVAGEWHGLNVSKIRVRALEQSSFWEHQIRFFEPASRVREKLHELGFQLPAVGEFREITGDLRIGIGLEEIPGGSALYCGTSIFYG